MYAHMDALHMLLFYRLPLQNRPPKLLGHIPTIRPVPQDSQAGLALYQPLHLEPGDDQHESQRDGLATTEHHHQRQRIHKYRRISLLPGNQLAICLLSGAELQRGHSLSHLCHS